MPIRIPPDLAGRIRRADPLFFVGKAAGLAVGSALGWYGAMFGFLVGHLIDVAVREARRGRSRKARLLEKSLVYALVPEGNPRRPLVEERYGIPGKCVPSDPAELASRLSSVLTLPDKMILADFLLRLFEDDPESLESVGKNLGIGVDGREWIRTARPDSEAYGILGLDEDASLGDVKQVYRNLVSQFHPDTLEGLTDDERRTSEAAFLKIQSAYETIVKERRTRGIFANFGGK